MYMNCQVRARLVFRRNCFGVVGPAGASRSHPHPDSPFRCVLPKPVCHAACHAAAIGLVSAVPVVTL